MKKIKIAFSDFWPGFDYNPNGLKKTDNVFYAMLKERFEVEISDNPDFLIYSVFGNNHLRYNCKKIFYTGENIRPNMDYCDYALTFDYLDHPKHHRFPLSAIFLYENDKIDTFKKDVDFDKIKYEKTKFCNFVFSNANPVLRNTLMFKLSQYKRVDSGGRAYNNLGYLVDDKLKFLNEYKFTICFENSETNGYTTEKIVHPKLVNSIPLYWGNPAVSKDWYTGSFVDYYKFNNLDDYIRYIIELDNDDSLYFDMLSKPHFDNDKIPHDLDYRTMLNFLEKVFDGKI